MTPYPLSHGLEVVLQVGLDIGRRHGRLVALDDLAVAADQELGEVPLDLVGAVCVRPDLRDGVVEAAVLRAEVAGRLGAQLLVQRVGVRAVDLDLGEHREGHVVGGLAEVLDLLVAAWLLLLELVAGKPEDLQAAILCARGTATPGLRTAVSARICSPRSRSAAPCPRSPAAEPACRPRRSPRSHTSWSLTAPHRPGCAAPHRAQNASPG